MRLLITGSRKWDNPEVMAQAIADADIELSARGRWVSTIVVGDCPDGADPMAAEIAELEGYELERYEADWVRYGKPAGPIRNLQMVNAGAEMCLAFFKVGAGNAGTNNCVKFAEHAGIPVRRYYS